MSRTAERIGLTTLAALTGFLAGCNVLEPLESKGHLVFHISAVCPFTGSGFGYVDGKLAGVFRAGMDVSREVDPGHHTVGAVTDDGFYSWPTTTITFVGGETQTRDFICPGAVVRVSIGTSCNGKTTNVNVLVDGALLGQVQPGGLRVTKEVTRGSHTVTANGSGGYTWSTSKSLNWADEWDLTLDCA